MWLSIEQTVSERKFLPTGPMLDARIWFFLILSLCVTGVRADYFDIRGKYEATFYQASGAVQTNEVLRFNALLDRQGKLWILRTFFGDSEEWYYETVGIGDAVYNVHYNPFVNPSWGMPGSVFPGYYPYLEFYKVTGPWMAYCSFQYFTHDEPAHVPAPRYHPVTEVEAFGTHAEVTYIENGPFKLPSKITWYADAARMAKANFAPQLLKPQSEGDARLLRKDLRYVLKPGEELSRYEVISYTNVGGVSLPTCFEFRNLKHQLQYRYTRGEKWPPPEGLEFSIYLRSIMRGHADSVVLREGPLEIPRFPKKVAVGDFRTMALSNAPEGVEYFITDGQWKTNVEGALQHVFEAEVRSHRKPQRQRQALVSILVAVVLAPPLAVGCAFLWRRRQRKKGEIGRQQN